MPVLMLLFCVNLLFNVIIRPLFIPIPSSGMLEMLYLGREWQIGYYKHPPLTGWIVAGLEMLFKGNIFVFHALPQVYLMLVLFFVFKIAREFVSERHAIIATVMLFIYPAYGLSSDIFDTDTIIILPFIMSLYFYLKFLQKNNYLNAILFGVSIGLGMLGKYFFIIPALAFAVHAIFYAKLYKNIKIYIAGYIAFLVFLPNLYWLFTHDFIALKYGHEISHDNPKARGLSSPIKFTLLQIINLLTAVVIAWVIFWQKPHFRKIKEILLRPTFLEYFTLFMIFILFIFTLTTGSYGKSRFLKPLVAILPIYAVSLFPMEISLKRFKAVLYFIFFAIVVAYLIVIISGGKKNKQENTNYPLLAESIEAEWQQICGKREIKYLLIEQNYTNGGAISIYMKKHPTIIPYEDFKTAAYYANEDDYKKEGGVIVYNSVNSKSNIPSKIFKIQNKTKLSFFKNKYEREFKIGFNCGT